MIEQKKFIDLNEESIMRIRNIEKCLITKKHLLNNLTFECGELGWVLFYCYYAKFTNNSEYKIIARNAFNELIKSFDLNNFKKIYQSDSLDNHLANLGRFICFVKKNDLLDLPNESILVKLDTALFKLMQSKIEVSDFDYNSGATAAAYYFIQRLDLVPDSAHALRHFVLGLRDKAQIDAENDYYWISPSLHDSVFLGLSHGSAMIISILTTIAQANIERDICIELIRKASNFLLKYYTGVKFGHFPKAVSDTNMDEKPFCICYGDIGIAYALLKADSLLNSNRSREIVHEILEESLLRGRGTVFPPDASLTYGAAGLAAFFTKLFHLTQDHRFEQAANRWYREINSYAIHDTKEIEFQSMIYSDERIWNLSFSWGIIGIGISLMRYVDATLPELSSLSMIA